MRDWWVTVLLARDRSCDLRIRARSEWSAGWLARQLHPGLEVVMVRKVGGGSLDPPGRSHP